MAKTPIPDSMRPSENLHDRNALYPYPGSSGDRLRRILELTPEQFDEVFDRFNLIDHWHGKQGKGDKFVIPWATETARKVGPMLTGRKVILLGRGVAVSFRLAAIPLEEARCEEHGFDYLMIPHPSGINRWWNDKRNVAATAFALKHFAGL